MRKIGRGRGGKGRGREDNEEDDEEERAGREGGEDALAVARNGVLLLGLVEGQEENPLVLAADALEVLANVDAVGLLLPLDELLDEAGVEGDDVALLVDELPGLEEGHGAVLLWGS